MRKNDRFVSFINKHAPARPILPAVHTTNVTFFGSVVDDNALKLKECRFYKEDLLYFFYGKPSYRISRSVEAATRLLGDAAVSFVFDLAALPAFHRSFAFDTGAFFGKRYDEFLPGGVAMEDFRIPMEYEGPAKLVTAFFGNNRDYFHGRAKKELDIPALDRASEIFHGIISTAVSKNFDDRSCTCELQFKEPVTLDAARLLTVIAPDLLLDDTEVLDAMQRWNVKPIPYGLQFSTPSERTAVIIDKLGEYYKSSGFM